MATPTPPPTPPSEAALTEALGRLWMQFLPQMKERVAAIESANEELVTGLLTEEKQEAAHNEAHKLAGVLGTFGLTRGTILAREAEIHYASGDPPDAETAAQLVEIAAELRAIIENHK